MKKGWKIFWIILAICGGTGLAMCLVALGMGFSFKDLYIEYREPQMTTVNRPETNPADNAIETDGQQIKELQLYADFCDIEFLQSGTDQFYVDTSEIDHIKGVTVHTTNENGILKIDMESGYKHGAIHHIKNHFHDRKVYVYYPRNYAFDHVELSFDAGKVEVENLITKTLKIDVGAGECSIDNLSAEEVDGVISVGQLEVEGAVAKKLGLECATGTVEVELYGRKEDYNYDISCQAGTVQIADQRIAGVAANKKIDNGSTTDIDLSCGAGTIEIDFE